MRRDLRVDRLAAEGAQARQGFFLVQPDEPTVAGDFGRQARSELAFERLCRDQTPPPAREYSDAADWRTRNSAAGATLPLTAGGCASSARIVFAFFRSQPRQARRSAAALESSALSRTAAFGLPGHKRIFRTDHLRPPAARPC